MPRIYISHRPEDSSRNEVAIIRQQLIDAFGAENILESTGSNTEITTHLQRLVRSCDVLLVVIGRYWSSMVDEDGETLIKNPYDPIHVELDAGLKTLMVFKVIVVDSAPLPKKDNLPETLYPLLNKDVFDVQNDIRLKNVLDELIIQWSSIPTGTMADEHAEDESEKISTWVEDQTPSPLSSSSILSPARYVGFIFIGVILCSVLSIVILMSATHQNPLSPPVKINHIVDFSFNASDIGFILVNGFMYADVHKDGDSKIYYILPEKPTRMYHLKISLEDFKQSGLRTQLTPDEIDLLETELGETIVFTSIDYDDDRVLLMTANTTLFIVEWTGLELISSHRLIRSSVRQIIPNETLVYNGETNLLMLLLGSNELNTWKIEDSPQFQGVQTIESDSSYVYEIAIDRSGAYLAVRSDAGSHLYGIEQ